MTIRIEDAVAEFLAALKAQGYPDSTAKQYASTLRRLCARMPGRRMERISQADLAAALYGSDGLTLGRALTTASTMRSAIRSFFRYADLRGWTRGAVQVPAPVFRERSARAYAPPTRLAPAQLLQLLDAADEPVLRAMVATAVNTALRFSDLRKIEMHHLDLRAGSIYVHMQKTGLQDMLPITADLDAELRTYLSWYCAETGVKPGEYGAYLFPGQQLAGGPGLGGGSCPFVPAPSRPAGYDAYRWRLHKLYQACGIQVESRECWHVIRRSVARIYFDALRDQVNHDSALRQTAALLGHRNSATTEKYLGLSSEVAARDASLRGRSFLQRADNVVSLRRAL